MSVVDDDQRGTGSTELVLAAADRAEDERRMRDADVVGQEGRERPERDRAARLGGYQTLDPPAARLDVSGGRGGQRGLADAGGARQDRPVTARDGGDELGQLPFSGD
jgi:hypothetical protein